MIEKKYLATVTNKFKEWAEKNCSLIKSSFYYLIANDEYELCMRKIEVPESTIYSLIGEYKKAAKNNDVVDIRNENLYNEMKNLRVGSEVQKSRYIYTFISGISVEEIHIDVYSQPKFDWVIILATFKSENEAANFITLDCNDAIKIIEDITKNPQFSNKNIAIGNLSITATQTQPQNDDTPYLMQKVSEGDEMDKSPAMRKFKNHFMENDY